MNNTTFIETVSNFNRELFHSKAITWLLNGEYPQFQKGVLDHVLGQYKSNEAEFILAIAEIKQIDILVIYKIKNELNFIHIENKIKATESFKKKDKYTQIANKNMLSQTEYYYTRLASKDFSKSLSQEILKNLATETKINLNKIHIELGDFNRWKFIFLKPSHVLHEKLPHFNSWREDITESRKLKNPWITMSYAGLLINNLHYIKNTSASAKEYVLFLTEQFTSKDSSINTSNYLNYTNVEKAVNAVKAELNIIEISALQEWFLLLEHELHLDKRFHSVRPGFSTNNTDFLAFESKFLTDTGNNGGFLIQASFLIPDFPFPKATTAKQKTARLGLQYEHNSNGAKMKLFFAANDYDQINILSSSGIREEYNKGVEDFLSDKNFKNFNKKFSWDNKFNGSRGKSFCSRSNNIFRYNSHEELKSYFIENLISLSKDIQYLKYETWRNFIQNVNQK